jgi:hypothetical protein
LVRNKQTIKDKADCVPALAFTSHDSLVMPAGDSIEVSEREPSEYDSEPESHDLDPPEAGQREAARKYIENGHQKQALCMV